MNDILNIEYIDGIKYRARRDIFVRPTNCYIYKIIRHSSNNYCSYHWIAELECWKQIQDIHGTRLDKIIEKLLLLQ